MEEKLKRSNAIEAWHFLTNDLKFRYGDGNVAVPGFVYSVVGEIELCAWGLHGSISARDALGYAPGNMIGRVLLYGDVIEGADKVVASKREYLWIANAEETLRDHARWCAMQVIELWDAPDIVRRYLETGDESLGAAARDAAGTAAGAAAGAAARAAARYAARDAAWDAARDAQNTDLTARLMALGAIA